MDKPKVSIKINGRERSFYEATSDKHNQKMDHKREEQQKPNEKEMTSSEPIQHEPYLDIDEVLAKEEVAAGNEEREFDWILPQQDTTQEDKFKIDRIVGIDELRKKKNPGMSAISFGGQIKKKKKEAYPLKTLLLAIVSALVIGTCFGMVVLRLFTGETIPVSVPSKQTVPQTEVSEQEGAGSGSESANDQAVSESYKLPPLNAFMVQGGVFSSEEAVGPIIEEMKAKGFAGTSVHIEGKYYLFLGIGLSKEAGTAIRSPYDDQGQDTYVKAISTPELSASGDPAVLQARQLFDNLVTYSTNAYSSLPQQIKWEEIKTMNEQINSSKAEGESTTSLFIAAVKDAYSKVEAYQTSSSTKDFWATQQALLTSYQIYQNWILENKN